MRNREQEGASMTKIAVLLWALQAGATTPSETTPLRVAGAQIPVVRDIRKNVEAISRAIEYAAREKADVLITPEGSLSGYVHDFDPVASGAALKEVLQKAREARLALVLGTCYEEDGA